MLTSRLFLFFSRYVYVGLLALCSVGLLGGCNVFGSGSLDEGDSVDELVADADVAMTKGNYDAAVESLEKAYDEEPDNPEVRIKLSKALYGQQGITVVDLKRVVDYISGLEEDQAKSKSLGKNSYECSVESAEPDPAAGPYTEIDLERTTTFGPFTDSWLPVGYFVLATVLTGGRRHTLGGLFFEPTVLGEVTPAMRIFREETFGPVAPLLRFRTEREAIALANDTIFGLAAYVYSRDLGRVFRVGDALEYGMVGVNSAKVTGPPIPFGGHKQSGLGREGSRYGLDEYTELKYLCLGGIDD